MKKLFCLLTVVVMLAIPTSVFSKSYIGAGVFSGSVDYADSKIGMYDDIRPFGGVVRLGTYLTPGIALEARYIAASGEESASDNGGGKGKEDFDLSATSILAKFDIPRTGRVQLYGLLGWSSARLEVLNVSDKSDGVAYGFGVEVATTKHTFLSADYNRVANDELCDIAGFVVLFNGRF